LTDINHFGLRRSGAASPKRWGERKSVLVDTSPGGECSIDSTYHVDMPKSTIASRGGIGLRAQWVEPREGFRRVRGCTSKSIVIDAIAGVAAVGVSRVGAERERASSP
jgi:hypothetical protein